jgi:hypothetical protein
MSGYDHELVVRRKYLLGKKVLFSAVTTSGRSAQHAERKVGPESCR